MTKVQGSSPKQSTAIEGEVIAKHAGGRPPKLTPLERAEVYEALRLYIERTPDPTVVGFCAWDPVGIKYRMSKTNMYDWEEFSPLIKQSIAKQEAFLLQAAGQGRYNATLAIFRLKQPQHGYRDRIDTDITSDGKSLQPLLVSFITNKQDVLPDGNDTDT